MCISPLSILINSCCCVLAVLLVTSTYAYVIESDDARSSYTEPTYVLSPPNYNSRLVRSTKFPRIGRSPTDIEELPVFFDGNASVNNEENDDSRWFEQRSVLFPRIGKRAFRHSLGAGSFTRAYPMLDGQNRFYVNGDADRLQQGPLQAIFHSRDKRNIPM